MKYLCLVYLEGDKFTAVPDRECMNCGDDLKKKGLLLAAEPLFPVETAKTLRIRNGRVAITDGPFAETKEQLAGFYLIDAANHDEALADRREDSASARRQHRGAASQRVAPLTPRLRSGQVSARRWRADGRRRGGTPPSPRRS